MVSPRIQLVAIRVLALGGIAFAVLAALMADNLPLSLGFGAVAASFLTLAGLAALAFRMPSLPPLILPPTSLWQGRVRQALAGDGLARLTILESLSAAAPGGRGADGRPVLDRRDEVLSLPRRDFDQLVRSEVARIEGEV